MSRTPAPVPEPGAAHPLRAEPVRFERRFHVEPADIDDRGHVNNVVYVRWVQEAAAAHWESAASPEQLAALAWVLVRHEIAYKHAAMPGDHILARTWVGEAAGATFERHVELFRESDRRLLASSRTLWCPVDARSGRPRRVSADLQACFHAPPAPGQAAPG